MQHNSCMKILVAEYHQPTPCQAAIAMSTSAVYTFGSRSSSACTNWPLWRTKQSMDSFRRTWLVTVS